MKISTSFLLVASLLSTSLYAAADTNSLTDAQKEAVKSVVHDYLVNQPEVLIEASQALQKKQQQQMQQGVKEAVSANAKAIFSDNLTMAGNPKGTVTLVEFFDYQCIHCKKMATVVDEVIKKSPSLRVVFKEFPIFGAGSDVASRAALAAAMQHKYEAMHNALINEPGHLNEDVVMKIAKKLNLNIPQLKKDMASKEVRAELDANRAVAEKIHLMGTPAFIIAATPKGMYETGKPIYFIPGAASEASMLDFIKQAQG